ncbi:MAG: hypothetical protein Ct9H90mP28_5640 [Paracoccaceae bacterium]|nr:MAG: hypothetical protein Ct9H90mP28_5640 [Paracoccaceae bacterium]
MTISLLFYSNYCQHCKQIVKEIKRSPVSSQMRYVCIDSSAVREKLPKYITSVPSLVVGETNQIFVGNQITGWLKMQPILNSNSNSNSNRNFERREPVMNQVQDTRNNTKDEPVGPNGWHNNEMNAFSDGYSFLGIDTSAQGDGGMSMVHNFETLGGGEYNNSPSTRMPGGAPANPSMPVQYGNPVMNPGNSTSEYGSIQMSEKTEELNKQMEEMMSRRELDVPNVPARI